MFECVLSYQFVCKIDEFMHTEHLNMKCEFIFTGHLFNFWN